MALTVYKASAGSGKTFTLAKAYIKLLILNPQDYKHILAITFTKKATEEMKTRILHYLVELSNGTEAVMEAALLAELGTGFDESLIKRRAAEAYELIIHNYSRFEVSTIDSFFSRVLKSFARELDLPLSYEVEMNQDLVLNESIENLYRQIDGDKDLLRWLTQFAKHRIEQDKTWNLDEDIRKLGRNLFSEDFQDNFDKAKIPLVELEGIIDQLNKEVKVFENTLKGYAENALDIISTHQLVLEDFSGGSRSVANAFNKFIRSDFKSLDTFFKCARGEKSWYAQTSKKIELIESCLAAGLQEKALSIDNYYHDHLAHYLTATAIVKNIYSFGLLEALYQQVKEYRDEHNILLISDTNKILKDVLDVADAPIMFEKLGSTYKHIMVDEFQDTSSFQWINLKPLIINSLSEGHEVLIVGDVKQSIYRFRGGNMKLLLTQIKQDLIGFYPKGTDQNLDTNYRSLARVVEFNNALFDKLPKLLNQLEMLADSSLFLAAFNAHEQKIKHKEGGLVQAKFFNDENEWKPQAIDHLVKAIKLNLSQGYGFGDMLILVDRNKEIADIVLRFMVEKIPFINGDSLRLTQSELVVFLVELLRYLRSDKDEVLRLNLIILFSRLSQRESKKAFIRARGSRMTLQEAGFPALFIEQYHVLKQQSLVDLVHQLLLVFDLRARADIYLQQFLDIVLVQSQKGNNSISTFLDWWDKEGSDETISTSEITNAIRIMTIHRAKGLESPIVFVPFANWSFTPNATMHQFWTEHLPEAYEELAYIPLNYSRSTLEGSHFQPDLVQETEEYALDILNKTYVAFTRPREKLYLSAPNGSKGRKGVHQQLYQAFQEMDVIQKDESEYVEFVLGDEHPKMSNAAEEKDALPMSVYPKTQFLDQLSIRNDSERFFMLQETDQAKAITLGNQIHDVLADIITTQDLPMVLKQRLQAGEFTSSQMQAVENQVQQIFEHEQVSEWFSDQYEVYNERVLMFNGQELKPDRLLIKGAQAIVIDYKTGEESAKHLKQVNTYMQAVSAIGYEPKGYLLYIEPFNIKEVKL